MSALILNRLSLVYLLLVGATALSWSVGHGMGVADLRMANAAIVVVAFVKVRYVVREFMETRHAPPVLRILAEAWPIGVCLALVALYWIGAAANTPLPRFQGL
jgi:hypothetical protein